MKTYKVTATQNGKVKRELIVKAANPFAAETKAWDIANPKDQDWGYVCEWKVTEIKDSNDR